MKKAKIRPDPSPLQNPLSDLHKNMCVVISWTAPFMQNFVEIGSWFLLV